jgi:hypothetical protein
VSLTSFLTGTSFFTSSFVRYRHPFKEGASEKKVPQAKKILFTLEELTKEKELIKTNSTYTLNIKVTN